MRGGGSVGGVDTARSVEGGCMTRLTVIMIGDIGSGKGAIANVITNEIRKIEGPDAVINIVDEGHSVIPTEGHLIVKCNRRWWRNTLSRLMGDRT